MMKKKSTKYHKKLIRLHYSNTCISSIILILASISLINLQPLIQADQSFQIQRLSNEPNMAAYPCIGIYDTSIYIIWIETKGNASCLFLRISEDNGYTWTEQVQLLANKSKIIHPCLVATKDYLHLIFRDSDSGYPELSYTRSKDHGKTWEEITQLTRNHSRTFDIYDLQMIEENEILHVIWKDYRTGSSEIFYLRSINQGETWEKETRLTHDYKASYAPSIAAQNNHVVITWEDYSTHPTICLRQSNDYGKTWNEPVFFTNNASSINSAVTIHNNNIHVVWQKYRDGSWEIYHTHKEILAGSRADSKKITDSNQDSCSPKLFNAKQSMILLWQEQKEDHTVIYYKQSKDDGETWSKKTQLTNDTGSSSDLQLESNRWIHHIVWTQLKDQKTSIQYTQLIDSDPVIESIQLIEQKKESPTIRIYGTDAHFNTSELQCILRLIEEESKNTMNIQPDFYDDHWETIVTKENLSSGSYIIQAKIQNPRGNESKWMTSSQHVRVPFKSYASPSFSTLIIISAFILIMRYQIWNSKKTREETLKNDENRV